jgi:hypothetical protein
MSTAAHSNPTQAAQILAHLQTGARLTPVLALNLFGCFRLGARILELKKQGANIQKRTRAVICEHSGKTARVAEYFIPQPPPPDNSNAP